MGNTVEIYDSENYRRYTKPHELFKSINILEGIITGINIDNIVDEKEIEELTNWCDLHRHLINKDPYKSIIEEIDIVLQDNLLTQEEIEDIIWLCKMA